MALEENNLFKLSSIPHCANRESKPEVLAWWQVVVYEGVIREKATSKEDCPQFLKGKNFHQFCSKNSDINTQSQELGRSVHVDEIFQQTHIRASTGEFVDERSRRTHEEFEAKFSQIRSETASVGASTCAPLDPADEERLRNQCWLDVADGRYKGRVYGIGNVSAQDDCVDSYIQQTQASSSQQPIAEDILNLHTRVSTHDDQLRQMNSQLQGFIGVMMQYLPPPAAVIAQQFLQSQNQPQANVQPQQPQQPQQPTDQPQDDTVYGDY
ncbi:uncharacterized protein LOC108347677 [Vigna angularis]|uniref:uncharacterized protein LOC108347677 n=1 Tax=Phaseolus angularis TaxID=3914 RepID=UPI0022B5DE3B|nr:uncharacterized protein LOC108347677 [Vigna angularis]